MAGASLRIFHVVRAPIGGIFRHIVDLATAQAAAGHAVGIVCNSLEGGAFEDDVIARIAPRLAFGVRRFPMRRQVSPSDLRATRGLLRHLGALAPDIVHGHGSKGGIYGRLIGTWLNRTRPVGRVYSPHGGSLHYAETSLEGRIYFTVERLFQRMTDAIVHVSAYEAETYRRKVGAPRCEAVVIRNGLRPDEYEPVVANADARDLLYLGMLRSLKGIDVFLDALARLRTEHGRVATAHVIGQTDDLAGYAAMARSLGIAEQVAFHLPKPTREAFAMARALVVPSRAESMPYVVLEAIAAALPLVATRVGGIPEILGPRADELVPPGDAAALAAAIDHLLADPARAAHDAQARREWLEPRFHIDVMQAQVGKLYRMILDAKSGPRRVPEMEAPATVPWLPLDEDRRVSTAQGTAAPRGQNRTQVGPAPLAHIDADLGQARDRDAVPTRVE
ncbi:MAG TPA: glycosyltransferase family 4 protein [Xanthobacteraceae bacterium]|nr:glycosyltransferase family 4 protein [Xanthobacteraceae bacterium]